MKDERKISTNATHLSRLAYNLQLFEYCDDLKKIKVVNIVCVLY